MLAKTTLSEKIAFPDIADCDLKLEVAICYFKM
jgi:hypothetical protein